LKRCLPSEKQTPEAKKKSDQQTKEALKGALGKKVLEYRVLRDKVTEKHKLARDTEGKGDKDLFQSEADLKILRDEIDREIESKGLKKSTVYAWNAEKAAER
jgi:hypothetical protein